MNERNVEALEKAITALVSARIGPIDVSASRWLANALASRGVLAPSALTDEEAHDIRPGAHYGHLAGGVERRHPDLDFYEAFAVETRELLERIAKGDHG